MNKIYEQTFTIFFSKLVFDYQPDYSEETKINFMTHNLLVFGAKEKLKDIVISTLTGSQTQTSIEYNRINFNFVLLPMNANFVEEYSHIELQRFVSLFKDFETISACIFCINDSVDNFCMISFIRIIGSLFNANLVCVSISEHVSEKHILKEFNRSSWMEMNPPIFFLRKKNRQVFRSLFFEYVNNMISWKVSNMSILTTLPMSQDYAYDMKYWMEKVDDYVSHLSITDNILKENQKNLIEKLDRKIYLKMGMKWERENLQTEMESKSFACIHNKFWKPKSNEIISIKMNYIITKYICIGFEYIFLSKDNKTFHIKITKIQSDNCFLTLYTNRVNFYEKKTNTLLAKINYMENDFMNVEIELMKYRKMFMSSFDKIHRYYTDIFEKNRYDSFLSPSEIMNYQYKRNQSSKEIKLKQINFTKDLVTFNTLLDKIRSNQIVSVFLEECYITKEELYILLRKMVDTTVTCFCIHKNESLDGTCLIQAMKLITDTSLMIVNLTETKIKSEAMRVFITFMSTINQMHGIFYEDKKNEHKQRTLKLIEKIEKEIEKVSIMIEY